MTFPHQTKLLDAFKSKEEARNPKKKSKTAAAKNASKKKQKPTPPEEEEESDDGIEWTERGMEDYENSDAHTRRSKKEGMGSGVSLSASGRDRMPSLDDFLARLDPVLDRFGLEHVLETCYDMNFPEEARKLFVDKVYSYICLNFVVF